MGCCWYGSKSLASSDGNSSAVELSPVIQSTPNIIIPSEALTPGLDATLAFSKSSNHITFTPIKASSCCCLVPVSLEQDSSYFEVQLPKQSTLPSSITLGVSSKLPHKALNKLNAIVRKGEPLPENAKFFAICKADLEEGDTLGVGFNQNDFPVLKFYWNGVEFDSINRTVGTVYPFVSINCDVGCKGSVDVDVVFQESSFKEKMDREYQPVIAARGLI